MRDGRLGLWRSFDPLAQLLEDDVEYRDQENPERPGFYLITLKGSQQAGLTGLKGGIVRKVAVDRTRSSLERALGAIRQRLESRTD